MCLFVSEQRQYQIWSSNKDAVDQTLIRSVVARYDPATSNFYMQREVFSDVIREAGVSIRNLYDWMNRNHIGITAERLGSSLPRVSCYVFSKDVIGADEPV